ncbi:class I SAM-dependent methyltransferase [Alicyclobacillus sp. SO9]|uniref:class I SAM-dependent methyltransferase n=1 Tax=Alicyclobacillus sp. SO9 TaxID=2665646 RepID=UPI0018E8FB25|nr:class I SAM-dependent methyltransferase [Alicyclobacillus sp. SO9]QQE78270.1 methyltransferase domain-containing protein [Alicyclobacillus sp. SO9]
MKIPNFKTEEGALLYKDTVGNDIAPRVADILIEAARTVIDIKDTSQQIDILDLGCGPGTVSLALADNYPHAQIVGVDSSASMLAECRSAAASRSIENAQFVQSEASELNALKTPFHLVVSNLAFPFFPRPIETMQAVCRVMQANGSAIFTVPGRHTWEEFFDVAKSVVGPATKVARPFLTKFTQAEKLPESMTAAGFGTIQTKAVKIPFSFDNGQHLLNFFAKLFHLLDFAPQIAQEKLTREIDKRFPDGFTMHYEAIIVQGTKPRT